MQVDTVALEEGRSLLNINIVPESKGKSQPTVLVAILDVSGSMDGEAAVANASGELQGFSRLDLV